MDAVLFDDLMKACGTFEVAPVIAVAVSGGADSMALCLLANQWARGKGGRIIALTVDHGLRADSAEEAGRVAGWLAARDIEHHILAWAGAKPKAGMQAAARMARYRLLADWCASRQILHLLVAHHLEDQAETFLLRLARGSGVQGLACMKRIDRVAGHGRDDPGLLRPLLATSKEDLKNYLKAEKQPWIEDPSNRNEQFERVKARHMLASMPLEGMTSRRLAETADAMLRAHDALEKQLCRAIATYVDVAEAGYADVAGDAFDNLPEETGLQLLSRLITVIGGRVYAPRLAKLRNLYESVVGKRDEGATLGGCEIVRAGAHVRIIREVAAIDHQLPVLNDGPAFWDNRFKVDVVTGSGKYPRPLSVEKLGDKGWKKVVEKCTGARDISMPFKVKIGLPALFSGENLIAVPHLGYVDPDFSHQGVQFTAQFSPLRGLSG